MKKYTVTIDFSASFTDIEDIHEDAIADLIYCAMEDIACGYYDPIITITEQETEN